MTILSRNADPSMEHVFHQAIREDPHDPANHLIYADWLEEHGQDDRALHHRVLGRMLPHSEAARRYVSADPTGNLTVKFHDDPAKSDREFFHDLPHNPLHHYSRESLTRSRSTPVQASREATKAGILTGSLLTRGRFNSVDQAARMNDTPLHYAINGQRISGASPRAMRYHEDAAEAYLDAARDLASSPGSAGLYTTDHAARHRRAALAHIIAAFVHRQALGLPL
jgi:uncharacterized protein (TIGR02996 family)